MLLLDYSYDEYKMQKEEDKEGERSVRITCDEGQEEDCKRSSTSTAALHPVSTSHGNCPPNMYPEAFSDMAWEWAKQYDNVDVTIINYEHAMKAGMGGLVAVGMGSSRKPYGHLRNEQGKARSLSSSRWEGITFDTGGISLKPGANMDNEVRHGWICSIFT